MKIAMFPINIFQWVVSSAGNRRFAAEGEDMDISSISQQYITYARYREDISFR